MKSLWKWFRKEEGQSSYLFAVTAVVLLAVAGMVIDFGRPALTGRRLQSAADSAALSAARCLPLEVSSGRSEIEQLAEEYAAKNGFPEGSKVEVTLGALSGGAYYKLTVTVKSTVEYTMARIMGYDKIDLTRSASVRLQDVSGVRSSVPLSIKKNVFEDNVARGIYDMVLKFGAGEGTRGDYGAVDQDGEKGGGARDYEDRLREGYEGMLSIGDVIPVESGNMSGPTRRAIAARWDACTHGCTADHFEQDCPRVLMVPIVEVKETGKTLRVVGFAPFLLTSRNVGSGNECEVSARYIPGLVLDDAEIGGRGGEYGIYTIKLVE